MLGTLELNLNLALVNLVRSAPTLSILPSAPRVRHIHHAHRRIPFLARAPTVAALETRQRTYTSLTRSRKAVVSGSPLVALVANEYAVL